MSDRRFRVILYSQPSKGLLTDLPATVLESSDFEKAQDLANRLSEEGARVNIVDESTICLVHNDLLRGKCKDCGIGICSTCQVQTKKALCVDCATIREKQRRKINLRQLFFLFLFAVFLYEIEGIRRENNSFKDGEFINVAVVQFVPENQITHPLVRSFAAEGYQEVSKFFNKERSRYTGNTNSFIKLSVKGPWQYVPKPPIIKDLNILFFAFSSWKYANFWKELGKKHGIDPKSYPFRIFLVFTDKEGDLASGSVASSKARFGVVYVSLHEENTVYPLITLAHELAHLFGATDKYNEDFIPSFPKGYVEPYKKPLYPQSFAEIMAVDIPVGPGIEVEPTSFSQIRFGYQSAVEMGWIAQQDADSYYKIPAMTPSDLLYGAHEQSPQQ